MKRFNYNSADKTEIAVLILLFLYSCVSVLNDSLLSLSPFYRYFRFAVTFIGIALFICRNNNLPPARKTFFAIAILFAFVIAARTTGRMYLIVYAVLIIADEGCEPDKTLKVWLAGTLLALLVVFVLCWAGILTDHVFRYPSGRTAHCLGFDYYFYFPYFLFFCSVVYLYLRKDRVKLYDYLLLILVNLLMYRLSTVSLTFYLTFIFIILDFLLLKLKKIDLNKKPIRIFSGLLFPLGVAATFLLMVNYNPESAAWTKLNTLMHGRPGMMHEGYLRYPITLFGNRMEMIGNNALRTVKPEAYFYIDSGFAYSLLGYGLVFTFAVVVLYSILYIYSCRTNNKHLYAWLTCVLIFSLMNNIWVDVYYNPALLLSFPAFMGLEIKQKTARFRLALMFAGASGLAAIAAWLLPWFKTLGDVAVGGNPGQSILSAVLIGLLFLGLAFSLGGLLLKVLLRQQPEKRLLTSTVALLIGSTCGIITLNWQVNRLTAQNAEKLESERLAIETVQYAGDCRLLVDGPAELYRRAFGGVGRTLYHGNNLTALPNVAYITNVDNNLQLLIRRGYKYTEISKEHAIYTNSSEAEAALMASGYHLTGYYSHDCTVSVDSEEAVLLPSSPYRVTYDLCFLPHAGRPVPEPETVIATLVIMEQEGETPLAERPVLFSEFNEDGTCTAMLDFSIGRATSMIFSVGAKTDTGDVFLRSIHYCQHPPFDTHFTCDVSGRRISEACYDLSGDPITFPDGSHDRDFGYDRYGNVTYIRYLDLNNNPVISTYGYAEIHRRFNSEGEMLREEYFDETGLPCAQAAGHVAIEQEYDSDGNLICRNYLNEDGTPCLRSDGFSEARWSKKEDSSVWNLELFSLNGDQISLDEINLAKDIRGNEWSAWMIPAYNTVNYCFNIGSVNLGEKTAGDVYTCQLDVEFSGVKATEGKKFLFATQGSSDGLWTIGNVWDWNLTQLREVPQDGMYHFVITRSINEMMAEASTFNIGFRCDNWASGSFRVRNVKIEKGNMATPWSPGI